MPCGFHYNTEMEPLLGGNNYAMATRRGQRQSGAMGYRGLNHSGKGWLQERTGTWNSYTAIN